MLSPRYSNNFPNSNYTNTNNQQTPTFNHQNQSNQSNYQTGFNGFDSNRRSFSDVANTANLTQQYQQQQQTSYQPTHRTTRKRSYNNLEPYTPHNDDILEYSKFGTPINNYYNLPNLEKEFKNNIPNPKKPKLVPRNTQYYNNGTHANNTKTNNTKQHNTNQSKNFYKNQQHKQSNHTNSRNSVGTTTAPVNTTNNHTHQHSCNHQCNHSGLTDKMHIDDASNSYKHETRLSEHTLDMKKLWYDKATKSWYNADDPFYEIKRLLNQWGNSVKTQKKIKPHIIIPNISQPDDESTIDWAISWDNFIKNQEQVSTDNVWTKLTPEDIEYKYYSKPRLSQNNQSDNENMSETNENDIKTNLQDISDDEDVDNIDKLDPNTESSSENTNISEEQKILDKIALFKPNENIKIHEQYLLNEEGIETDYKRNPIRSVPCMIIVLNPNGPFVTQNENWQNQLAKDWLQKSFPWANDEVNCKPWYQKYNEHYELQIDLPKTLFPDKTLKRDIYRLFKYDNYYNKYANSIKAIKRWKNDLNRRVSVYVTGDKPNINKNSDTPNKIGPNKWISMNIQTPNSALTWAQKKSTIISNM